MTIKLPSSFTYMHHTWKIIENGMGRHKESNRKFLGCVKWKEDTIHMNMGMADDVLKSTLAHELFHIVVDRSGLDLNDESKESLVDMLSYSMIEMFRSNPWFATFWKKGGDVED